MILAFSKDSPAEVRGNGVAGRGDFGSEHDQRVLTTHGWVVKRRAVFFYPLDISFISTAFK